MLEAIALMVFFTPVIGTAPIHKLYRIGSVAYFLALALTPLMS